MGRHPKLESNGYLLYHTAMFVVCLVITVLSCGPVNFDISTECVARYRSCCIGFGPPISSQGRLSHAAVGEILFGGDLLHELTRELIHFPF